VTNGPRIRGGGTVGVITSEIARFQLFQAALFAALANAPPMTRLVTAMGADISGNCNELCRQMTGEWLWIMGDDHAFEPELLPRLLAHDVDVVVPHCLKRNPPWMPVVFSHQDEEGNFVTAQLPENELVEIHAAGSAGMLVRRRVLEAIADPWFRPAPDAAGLNEDLYFCQQVREAGFKIHCDSGALLGHISLHTVWPRWQDGRWHLGLLHDQETFLPVQRLEQPKPEIELVR
jgi:hypothetical protein